MGSVLSSTAFTFCVREFMRGLIYSVQCIHGGTALIFRMLCPWLYEVLPNLRTHRRTVQPDNLISFCSFHFRN